MRRPGAAGRTGLRRRPPGATLERRLRRRLGRPIAVEITDNLHTMISFGRRDEALLVRLHHMFVGAPPPVLDALAGYVQGDGTSASRALDAYIERHRRRIRRVPPHVRRSRLALRPRGRHHDLGAILDELNALHFAGRLDCAITWGACPRVEGPRRSIKLGSYSEDAGLIRIHPALDQRAVPRFFVAWIVFHEMLHHVHRAERVGSRRRVHTAAFLADEARFPAHARARDWEHRHLDGLLSWRAPTRTPSFRARSGPGRMPETSTEERPCSSAPPV